MMYVHYEPVACHKAGKAGTAAVGRVGRAVGSSRTWLLVLGSM